MKDTSSPDPQSGRAKATSQRAKLPLFKDGNIFSTHIHSLSQMDEDPLRVNDIIYIHFGFSLSFKKPNSYPITFDVNEEEGLLLSKLSTHLNKGIYLTAGEPSFVMNSPDLELLNCSGG